MKKLLAVILLFLPTFVYAADNTVIVDPGSTITMRSVDVGTGIQSMMQILGSTSGTAIYGTAGTANANVITVQGIALMTPFLVSQATAASLNATVVGTGTFAVQAAQSGTWNITNISGTISLPTGAATSANQATEISSLATIATNTGAAIPTQAPTVSIGGVGIIDSAGVNVATVKAASTAPATTDKSVVVALNPNNMGTAGAPSGPVQSIQGVTSMTKLLVTPDSVALPANQSVNTSQVNGVTVLTGTGATGTGAQRVTVSTDQATNAGAALVKGGVGVVNGGSFYQAVAASQTATVLQSSSGATGDYLSHCVLYPTSTTAGVVTVFDNTNAAGTSAILFPGGTLSNLAPIAIPVGAVSTTGAWKVTTGSAISVVCFGKFS